MFTFLDQSVFPHTGVRTIQKPMVFVQAVFQSLTPHSPRRSLVGSAVKILFRVRLQYRQLRRLLLHLSKRKDRKDEVLAQICEKYLSRFCIIFALVRFKIFDHCTHLVNPRKGVKKHLRETPDPQIG